MSLLTWLRDWWRFLTRPWTADELRAWMHELAKDDIVMGKGEWAAMAATLRELEAKERKAKESKP